MDETFAALPLRALADAALSRAGALGCSHADIRVVRTLLSHRSFRDRDLESGSDNQTLGLSVRVVHDGVWGFAAGITLTPESAAALADRAVATARVSRPLTPDRVELADEPVYADVEWVSAYEQNPFEVPDAERSARMLELSGRLLGADGVSHTSASLTLVQENTFFADLAGTSTRQQRIRLMPSLTAISVSDAGFATMSTIAPPVGRGWEYLGGTGWDFDAEIA
jgi:TldD protein